MLFEVLELHNYQKTEHPHPQVSQFQVCRYLFSLNVSAAESQLLNISSSSHLGTIWSMPGKWFETFVQGLPSPGLMFSTPKAAHTPPPPPPLQFLWEPDSLCGGFQTDREDEVISGWLKKSAGQLRSKPGERNFSWQTLYWKQIFGLYLVSLRVEPAGLEN